MDDKFLITLILVVDRLLAKCPHVLSILDKSVKRVPRYLIQEYVADALGTSRRSRILCRIVIERLKRMDIVPIKNSGHFYFSRPWKPRRRNRGPRWEAYANNTSTSV